MFVFVRIIIFLLGLAVGSFLNVLIDRLPKEENVLVGRSYCDHCRHQLVWYDLIPLLSFVLLAGRCRYCQKKISWQNPLVELVTGGFFVLVVFRILGDLGGSGISVTSICYLPAGKAGLLFVICSLIVIFFADLKYGIIPDRIVFPAIVLTSLFHFAGVFLLRPTIRGVPSGHLGGGTSPILNSQFSILNYLLAGLVASGFFGLLVVLTKGRGMGLGDVKLAFLMGLVLGLPRIIVALYFAFLTGALVSAILILSKKKKFGQTVPFGPFLVGGTIFALFYGNQAIEWWLRIMM